MYLSDPNKRLTQYHLQVKNCECHDVNEVVGAFTHFLGMDVQSAIMKMTQVHNAGFAIVYTGHKEACESYAMQLTLRAVNYAGKGLSVRIVEAEKEASTEDVIASFYNDDIGIASTNKMESVDEQSHIVDDVDRNSRGAD